MKLILILISEHAIFIGNYCGVLLVNMETQLVKTNFQCCNRSSSKNIPTFKIKFLITTDSRIHNLRVEIMLSFQFNFIQVKTTVLLQKQILFRRYISKMQFLMMINFLIKSMFLSNSLIFFSRLLSFFLCFPDFF